LKQVVTYLYVGFYRWYKKNAIAVFGPNPPSLADLKLHARRIRPLSAARKYQANYYRTIRLKVRHLYILLPWGPCLSVK
jgi:hypothetical protein